MNHREPTVVPPPHGGTDDAGAPAIDFSTNANALGPSPVAMEALAAADPSRYPDPAYTEVRGAIGGLHDRDPDEVVVGGGACELIHRAVRTAAGPVVLLEPTFGEYRYAAALARAPVRATADAEAFIAALPGAALAVLCVPSSPAGIVQDEDWLHAAAAEAATVGCRLLLDLAYHPLSEQRPALPESAWQVWAPNKAHGVTGVRAAYLLAPSADVTALRAAPSWVLSAHGAAFLRCVPDPAAHRWVRETRRTLWGWRDELTTSLRALDLRVDVGAANYLLVHVGNATATTSRLRAAGIGVRDATSFGIPTALRLSAQPPAAQAALCAALGAPGST